MEISDLLIDTDFIGKYSRKAALSFAMQQNQEIEMFLISGAMPRDITLLLYPANADTSSMDGNMHVWSVSQPFRIN